MTTPYTTGQVILTNGSAVVTGVLTAWATALIAGGVIYPEADGNPLPIASVDGDLAITAATKWKGATGTYNYALVRDTAYLQQVSTNSSTLAQLVAELAAGTIFKYDASGDLAGRATYDTRPQSFAYLVSVGVTQPQLYVKGSATSGDWDGPFSYGVGPMGPATSLNFGATVTEPSTNPASVVVTGSGPYNLTFHIPRGADGDITWQGAWATAHAYSINQAVTNGGASYVCKLSHTSSSTNAPGTGASWTTFWDVLAAKGNTGATGPAGAMDPSVYDPQGKAADAFARANHTGTQALSTITGVNKYAVKTGNYTAVIGDNDAEHRFTATATLTLTSAATVGADWHYTVTADGGDVTIDPSGTQTINGQATIVVKNGTSCKIICDGSNFFAVMRTGLWDPVGVFTLSAASSFVLTNLGNAKFLRLTGMIDSMSAAGLLTMQVSTDNGTTYDTGTNYYSQAWSASSASLAAGVLSAAASFPLSGQGSSDVSTPVPFEAILSNFNKAARLNGFVRAFVAAGGAGYAQNMANFHLTPTARNALKIFNSGSGTMTGVIAVEQIRG
ncbi:hypothetical protein DTW90_30705 [Neorhizobium sp. P12A]|nr:hypothetical protein DTW90_30705 [Neorhizobium sp. P12A]